MLHKTFTTHAYPCDAEDFIFISIVKHLALTTCNFRIFVSQQNFTKFKNMSSWSFFLRSDNFQPKTIVQFTIQ